MNDVTIPTFRKNPVPNAPIGRTKGVPNKFTKSAREAFQMAFEGLGGVPALIAWGKKNPTDFYRLYCRLIPVQIQTSTSGEVIDVKPVSGAQA